MNHVIIRKLDFPSESRIDFRTAMVNRRRIVDDFDGRIRGGAISIGNFDGVHCGHAALAARLRAMADRIGGPAVAVTFDPSPAAILRPGGVPPQLTTIERRSFLLKQCGIDNVVAVKTDLELLSQTAEQFFEQLVVTDLAARGVVEGPNFYFGRNRAGDTNLLRTLCRDQGLQLEVVEPQSADAEIISSTRVRELLTTGQVDDANRLLTEPYQISGQVVSGAARGREIGFPTANLSEIQTLIPGTGVYACRVRISDHRYLDAATHIGPNPTFGEDAVKVEVHLLEYSGDLYGQTLQVDFVSRIRGVMKFASITELTRQLSQDIEMIRGRLPDNSS